jgi:hypothetical protein
MNNIAEHANYKAWVKEEGTPYPVGTVVTPTLKTHSYWGKTGKIIDVDHDPQGWRYSVEFEPHDGGRCPFMRKGTFLCVFKKGFAVTTANSGTH